MKTISQNLQKKSPKKITHFSINKENIPKNVNALSQDITMKKNDCRRTGQEIKAKINRPILSMEHSIEPRMNNLMREKNDAIYQDKANQLKSQEKSVKFQSIEEAKNHEKRHGGKSILKKSNQSLKSSMHFDKKSISSSICSHSKGVDQSVENIMGNKTIKEKYERILKELAFNKKKYTDDIYPPNQSALYSINSLLKNFCNMFEKDGKFIEWMRISDVFPHKILSVWNADPKEKCVISKGYISRKGVDFDYLAASFNSLKQKNNILEKMFESQGVNEQGIYYVKIHQTQLNIWKNIIIDDLIPVVINKKLPLSERYSHQNIYPAFLNVTHSTPNLEIWPFLLQKAFAKYYSTYDALGNGNTFDFIEEITGILFQSQPLPNNIIQIRSLTENCDTILFAEDNAGLLYPLNNKIMDSTQNKQGKFIYQNRDEDYQQTLLTWRELQRKFTKIHYGFLHKYYYTSSCLIKQQINMKDKKNEHNGMILRHFNIKQGTQCQIGVNQKEQRFYRNYAAYQYSWMRMVVVQRESNGYRWVNADYSNRKSIKLSCSLEPGHYIVILMPQWRSTPYDLNLMFYGNTKAEFERQSYSQFHNILPESCMDLAQRQGTLIQINKNICSYNYIHHKLGFIIQNVNNQKQTGEIKIVRSIQGLQEFKIQPINQQFQHHSTIEVKIKVNGNFTVVLKTQNGVDHSFLDMFQFGA